MLIVDSAQPRVFREEILPGLDKVKRWWSPMGSTFFTIRLSLPRISRCNHGRAEKPRPYSPEAV